MKVIRVLFVGYWAPFLCGEKFKYVSQLCLTYISGKMSYYNEEESDFVMIVATKKREKRREKVNIVFITSVSVKQ